VIETALEIVREIRARGWSAVIVGGAVRDLVLGRPLTDVDLATDMPLDELAALYRTHAVGRSEQFETVVVCRGGHAFEISRFRTGRGQQPPAAADRLREDTAHRDFTINALALGPDGALIDLQGGLRDVADRVVRCVGSPQERFAEDPVRMLRAVRFAACLGFALEERTAAAIVAAAPLLAGVAAERIGKEIAKSAAQPGAALAEAVELMDRLGLLGTVLPEVKSLQGLPQPIEWHPEGDAWQHTLAAVRSSASSDPAVNLAVLLHDVGKHPAHREVGGRHHYHGHDRAGAGIVDDVARRLHLGRRERAALAFAVGHHMQAGRLGELRRSKALALLAGEHWPVLRAVALCDVAARGDAAAVARLEAAFLAAEADAAAERTVRAGAAVITGSRIMELTGLAPGPRVGEIQRSVSEWALDNRVEDRERIEAQVLQAAAPGGLPEAAGTERK
jgi:tRNA nucleotidyltransferase/poly(A) polymerase